ncbi:unnamed protein product [Prunus armeniaca]
MEAKFTHASRSLRLFPLIPCQCSPFPSATAKRLIAFLPTFGGDITRKQIKFIGLVGRIWGCQRRKEGWVLGA